MKSHVKRSPQRSCLATSAWAVFSPDELDAGLGERAHQLDRHVLGRGEQLDLAGVAPGPLAGRGDRARATAARLRAHALGVELRLRARAKRARPGGR